MEICTDCGSNYDSGKIDIPNPIPDNMCAHCGTVLTKEQIEKLLKQMAIGE